MAKKPNGWWRNPVSIAALVVSFISISTWVVANIRADAKVEAKIDKTEEKVTKIAEEVVEHDKAIAEADKNQELIQRDLDYLKDSMKEQKTMQQQILEAIKQKR